MNSAGEQYVEAFSGCCINTVYHTRQVSYVALKKYVMWVCVRVYICMYVYICFYVPQIHINLW